MKLSKQDVEFIHNVLTTAKLVNIDNVIIEPDLVRAIDEDKTVVLHRTFKSPKLEVQSIGFNRIDVFLSRYNVVKSQPGFYIEAKLDEDLVRSLTMRSEHTVIDYRCANPATIQAPRQINDSFLAEISMSSDDVNMLQQGKAAMSADIVTITSNSGVAFELVDTNNDIFRHKFADGVESSGDDVKFAFRYPLKTLIPLFKQALTENDRVSMAIGEKGTLTVAINDINVIVLPRV